MNDQRPQRNFLVSWVAIGACLALLLGYVFHNWTVNELRSENHKLRAPPAQAAAKPEVKSIQPSESDLSQEEKLELIQLRGEVGTLRRELANLREQAARAPSVPTTISSPPSPVAPPGSPHRENVRQLVKSAMGGDAAALDKLGVLLRESRELDETEREAIVSETRQAFQTLGADAGKGDTTALQAIWQASRISTLAGYAVNALGIAAGQGNAEALEALVHPENYLILKSSAVSALRPAAEAGNAQAIQALAAVTADPKQRALWHMAAQGLESPAIAGNATAIDALALIATSENKNARERAVFALEAAARGKHLRAEDALKKLGWR